MDVTAYRWAERDAILWKDVAASRSEFHGHLLRKDEHLWLVYDSDGAALGDQSEVVSGHIPESDVPVEVDRSKLLEDVQDFMLNDDLTILAVAEGHAGASAADHSNLGVLCRRMILEADSKDLPHLFIVDSRRWACRVTGLAADMTRLSGHMTDTFIDRRQWLVKSWPLLERHHLEVLADRLAKVRPGCFSELIRRIGEATRLSDDLLLGLTVAWHTAGPGARYRCARKVVELLKDGIILHPSVAEEFSDDVIRLKGKEALQAIRENLL